MSLLWLLVLIADIFAIMQIVQSKKSSEKKALWIVLILILPFVGLILWYFLGRKG